MSEEGVATLSKPRRTESRSERQPCVGLPVQFHNGTEGVVPGVLQRQSITEPDLWDVKVSLNGSGISVTRSGVKFSAAPKAGCWSFLPN